MTTSNNTAVRLHPITHKPFVFFKGRLLEGEWNTRDEAEAYLDALQDGLAEPVFVQFTHNRHSPPSQAALDAVTQAILEGQ